MAPTTNRTIRYLSATAAALVVSSSLMAIAVRSWRKSIAYRHHQQEQEWSGDRHLDRLFRRILRSALVQPENRPRYRHRHADVRWAKAHRRHKTREVCRIKTKSFSTITVIAGRSLARFAARSGLEIGIGVVRRSNLDGRAAEDLARRTLLRRIRYELCTKHLTDHNHRPRTWRMHAGA